MNDEIKRLREQLTNWEDTSMEGLRKRAEIETKIYIIEKKKYLRKTTRKRLGVDDGSHGRIT